MDPLFSKSVKAGTTTFFIDVLEAKNKSKYITLTASTPSKGSEQKKFSHKRIFIFDNAAEQVRDAIVEATSLLKR